MKTWDRHQQIRAKKSKYPAPVGNSNAAESKCYQLISNDSKCSRNPIQSESESNPNPTTLTRTREEETPFGNVTVDPLIIKVQKELNGLTDTHYSILDQYRQELGDDLVSLAIDNAVAQGVRKWAYVERILTNWQEKGVKTVGDAKAEDEKHRKAAEPEKPKKTVTAQRFPQRQYDGKQLEDEFRDDFLKYAGVQ